MAEWGYRESIREKLIPCDVLSQVAVLTNNACYSFKDY